MLKDGQLLPEFSCFPLHCCFAVAFCTGLLLNTQNGCTAPDTHIAFHHAEHFAFQGSSLKYPVDLTYMH